MDLGATLCTRRRPACDRCPLPDRCVARADGIQNRIPAPRKRAKRPQRETRVLVALDSQGRVLLEKRPPAGIWGGLWSLPEMPVTADVAAFCDTRLGLAVTDSHELAPFWHAFTHFELLIHATRVQVSHTPRIMDASQQWFACDARPGVPAPIARLLDTPQKALAL